MVTVWLVARQSKAPAVKNITCDVSINVRGLNRVSAKGVENDTVMLTSAIKAIAIEYCPRSNPISSIINTGETLT